jgi:hypothetical protein
VSAQRDAADIDRRGCLKRIAVECAFIFDRGAVGIRLKPAARGSNPEHEQDHQTNLSCGSFTRVPTVAKNQGANRGRASKVTPAADTWLAAASVELRR